MNHPGTHPLGGLNEQLFLFRIMMAMVYRAKLDAIAGSGEAYRWLKLVGADWLNQFGIEEKQVQLYIERIEECQMQ